MLLYKIFSKTWLCQICLKKKVIGKSWLGTLCVICQCRAVQADMEFRSHRNWGAQDKSYFKNQLSISNLISSLLILFYFLIYIWKQLLSLVFSVVFQKHPAGICNYLYLRPSLQSGWACPLVKQINPAMFGNEGTSDVRGSFMFWRNFFLRCLKTMSCQWEDVSRVPDERRCLWLLCG